MAGNHGMPVILATAGNDHTIGFWQAHSGICHRTIQHPDSIPFHNCFVPPASLLRFIELNVFVWDEFTEVFSSHVCRSRQRIRKKSEPQFLLNKYT